jgi:hypothetical protein
MSTKTISREEEIESEQDPRTLLHNLEANSSLIHPGKLRERLTVLDDLDAAFGDFSTSSPLHQRANKLRAQLEAANANLYHSLRSNIIRGQRHAFLQSLQNAASQQPSPGLGFDCQDELLSGVLQLREPDSPDTQTSPEMVFYQPTPTRHILDLIAATALTPADTFVDLGSGLGHVPLLISLLTKAQSLGIEIQPAYVATARECAQSLHLNRVHFISQDAREADLSTGTVFYLYSPFKGSILTTVLTALRTQSTRRPIKICSLGPCTQTLANETWLTPTAPPDTNRITVFHSRER